MSSRAEQKAAAREARLAAERADAAAAQRRRLVKVFGGVLALAAIIVAAAIFISQSGSEPEVSGSERMELYAGIPQDGTRLGSPDAPVVVTEFADLQCPFCAQATMNELPQILRERVRPGQVQLDLRLLTFLGPDSVRGARLAMAAAMQDRLWQFTDAFYEDQGEENSGYATDDFLRDVAGKVPGLEVDRAFADRESPQITEQLTAARRDATEAGVDSTPTFLVGPRGGEQEAVSAEQLPAAIDRALRAAE